MTAILETLRPHLSGLLVSLGVAGIWLAIHGLTRLGRRRPSTVDPPPSSKPSGPESGVPVEHHGAEDDAETGEWLQEIATVQVDPFDALLAEFGAALDEDLAEADDRFWVALGPSWARLVRADQGRLREAKRAITLEFVHQGGSLEDTQPIAVGVR